MVSLGDGGDWGGGDWGGGDGGGKAHILKHFALSIF